MTNSITQSRILIVSGIGRNSGKTTSICRLIEAYSALAPIIAVKISGHRHQVGPQSKLCYRGTTLEVYEETAGGNKDSQRFLHAGATRSFYIQGTGNELLPAWNYIWSQIPEDGVVVCETGSLASLILNAVTVIMTGEFTVYQTASPNDVGLILSWQDSVTDFIKLREGYWQITQKH